MKNRDQIWQHHVIPLLVLLGSVTFIYSKVSRAYFCSYDDFLEVHRAAFEDSRAPERMFTTSHFNSYKYRPLNRVVDLFTYWLGHGNPVLFRVRNLFFHLVNIILVYTLGQLLIGSTRVSGVGAAIFGLHPMANQSVIGAVWTNSLAHSGFLLALVMFMISARTGRRWLLWLVGGLLSAWLSILAYDSEIVVFGLMLIYWVVLVLRREQSKGLNFPMAFVAASGALLSSYFLLRTLFVPHGLKQATATLPSLLTMGKNLGMYVFALLFPVDLVLANEWLHTPLPSEIMCTSKSTLLGIGVLLLFSSALGVIIWRLAKKCSVSRKDINWGIVLFLMSGIAAPLLPVLLLAPHPSETYLYLPAAFYGLLLSYGIITLLRHPSMRKGKALYVSAVLLLISFFTVATWVRNQRVTQCGDTAQRILNGLPQEFLKDQGLKLLFANVPGEQVSHRYGFYGFRGIDTIGDGPQANRAITAALHLVFQNELLTGEIVKPEELLAKCHLIPVERQLCVWVHWDGRTKIFSTQD